MALNKSKNRLLFEPLAAEAITKIKSTLRATTFDGSYHDAYQVQLDDLIPSRSLQALIGDADTRPLEASVGSRLGVLSPSPDLVLQYRADGTLSSHSDSDCVALVPRYFQKRDSSLALCLGIMLIAVLCKNNVASVSERLLHQLEDILEALYPLERAYRRKSPDGLSLELKELAGECNRLMAQQATSTSLPRLLSSVAIAKHTTSRGDIAAIKKSYAKRAIRLRRDSGDHRRCSDRGCGRHPAITPNSLRTHLHRGVVQHPRCPAVSDGKETQRDLHRSRAPSCKHRAYRPARVLPRSWTQLRCTWKGVPRCHHEAIPRSLILPSPPVPWHRIAAHHGSWTKILPEDLAQ